MSDVKLTKTACKLLHEAEEILKPRGAWTQGVTRDSKGRHCAVGAIYEAAGMYRDEGIGERKRDAMKLAIRALDAQAPGNGIVRFNDRWSTKKRDVLAIFRKARKAGGC